MPTLHTINKPLSSLTGQRMLNSLSENDAVILIEDACNSIATPEQLQQILESSAGLCVRWYALDSDCSARGLTLPKGLAIATINEFVKLASESEKTVSWY